MRIVVADPSPQPALPGSVDWHVMTLAWWERWRTSPLSTDYTSDEWSYLLDTALIHNELWGGDMKVASELRLRVAKFGQTPEDRARLRIQFATADEIESKNTPPDNPDADSRHRYSAPKAV